MEVLVCGFGLGSEELWGDVGEGDVGGEGLNNASAERMRFN